MSADLRSAGKSPALIEEELRAHIPPAARPAPYGTRARLLGTAIAVASVPGFATSRQRRYYDPGAKPMPVRKHEDAGQASIPVYTRQLRRAIERELRHPSFDRARLEAKKHGWEVPSTALPLAQQVGRRKVWLQWLELAGQAARQERDRT